MWFFRPISQPATKKLARFCYIQPKSSKNSLPISSNIDLWLSTTFYPKKSRTSCKSRPLPSSFISPKEHSLKLVTLKKRQESVLQQNSRPFFTFFEKINNCLDSGVEYSPEMIASEVKKTIDNVADELFTKRYQLFPKIMTTLTERMPFCPTYFVALRHILSLSLIVSLMFLCSFVSMSC